MCGVVVASGADGVCVVWWLLVVMLQSTYILACLIPTQDPGGQHIGFLLNSLRVTVALTSENTAKNLPKEENKDIVHFRGLGAHTHTCTGNSRRSAKSLHLPLSPVPIQCTISNVCPVDLPNSLIHHIFQKLIAAD